MKPIWAKYSNNKVVAQSQSPSDIFSNLTTIKGWVEKNLLFEKIDMALEGERFVL